MSAPVFLAERALGECEAGSVYVLDGAEGRHAGVVQRRGPGEQVDVVDGDGTRLRCVVEAVDASRVTLRVAEIEVEAPPDPVVTLVQALAKGDRDELAIEIATELGVDAIVPWQAERSIVVWRGDRAAKSRARWLATVRAAAKQSRRARLPRVDLPVDSRGLAARIAAVVSVGGVAVVLHEEARTSFADVPLPGRGARAGAEGAATLHAGVPEVFVVVGPEGGIGERELAALVDAGAVTARLGPHVLRTSTAGPVAVALLSQRLGRWDGVGGGDVATAVTDVSR